MGISKKLSDAPFDIQGNWPRFALGLGVLWFTLIFAVEAGAGEPASALAVLIAGGMTVHAIDSVIKDLGFAPPKKGTP